MTPTPHASQRWAERFPGQDMAAAYGRAVARVGRKTRAKLAASCPANVQFVRGAFRGRYFKMTHDHIVFVMMPPETIITVFKLAAA